MEGLHWSRTLRCICAAHLVKTGIADCRLHSIVWFRLNLKPAAFAKAQCNWLLINKAFSFHVVS